MGMEYVVVGLCTMKCEVVCAFCLNHHQAELVAPLGKRTVSTMRPKRVDRGDG